MRPKKRPNAGNYRHSSFEADMPPVLDDLIPVFHRHAPSGRAVVTIDGRDFYTGLSRAENSA